MQERVSSVKYRNLPNHTINHQNPCHDLDITRPGLAWWAGAIYSYCNLLVPGTTCATLYHWHARTEPDEDPKMVALMVPLAFRGTGSVPGTLFLYSTQGEKLQNPRTKPFNDDKTKLRLYNAYLYSYSRLR